METQSPITVRLQGPIAIITLNFPEKLNALSTDNVYLLGKRMREIDRNKDIYITVLTGTGQFFSSGGTKDIFEAENTLQKDARWNASRPIYVCYDTAHTFAYHSKILVVALNGPVVGICAALVAQADFIYAAPHSFLLIPFASLGMAPEGGVTQALVQRLGISKASEAILMSKRISCEELVTTGFVNKVIPTSSGNLEDSPSFLKRVLEELNGRLGPHLNYPSLITLKVLLRRPGRQLFVQQHGLEVSALLDKMESGVPQEHFREMMSGNKRHKL